ncbi:MAG: hypothetical protein Q8N05_13715 [Bacteroidota bacterium]|nr:hypothetical protein [Bacteroidota bacterium]
MMFKLEIKSFITAGMNNVCNNPDQIADQILHFTDGHPYYTQQLAYNTWIILNQGHEVLKSVEQAIAETVQIHDFDYERLWATEKAMNYRTKNKK